MDPPPGREGAARYDPPATERLLVLPPLRPAPPPRRPSPRGGAGPEGAARDPVSLAEALDSALPRRFSGKLLDLELLRRVWSEAVGAALADRAFPVRFERGVVTIRAAAPEVARSLDRQRAALRERLLNACRLPNASLRIRVASAPPAGRSPGAPPADRAALARKKAPPGMTKTTKTTTTTKKSPKTRRTPAGNPAGPA